MSISTQDAQVQTEQNAGPNAGSRVSLLLRAAEDIKKQEEAAAEAKRIADERAAYEARLEKRRAEKKLREEELAKQEAQEAREAAQKDIWHRQYLCKLLSAHYTDLCVELREYPYKLWGNHPKRPLDLWYPLEGILPKLYNSNTPWEKSKEHISNAFESFLKQYQELSAKDKEALFENLSSTFGPRALTALEKFVVVKEFDYQKATLIQQMAWNKIIELDQIRKKIFLLIL